MEHFQELNLKNLVLMQNLIFACFQAHLSWKATLLTILFIVVYQHLKLEYHQLEFQLLGVASLRLKLVYYLNSHSHL